MATLTLLLVSASEVDLLMADTMACCARGYTALNSRYVGLCIALLQFVCNTFVLVLDIACH